MLVQNSRTVPYKNGHSEPRTKILGKNTNLKNIILEPIKELKNKSGFRVPKKKNLSYIEELMSNPVL